MSEEKSLPGRENRPASETGGHASAAKPAQEKSAAEKTADIQAKFNARKMGAEGAKKGIVQVRSLHIRNDHSTEAKGVGGLVRNDEVDILETWTDGKNTWARIGPDQWAAMIYEGETYIKVE